jgi:hypothetical protein
MSFQLNAMSNEELIECVRRQQREIEIIKDMYLKKELQSREDERKLRIQAVQK